VFTAGYNGEYYAAFNAHFTVGVQSLARAKSLALLTFGANFKYLK
jgi:hypothetical protein